MLEPELLSIDWVLLPGQALGLQVRRDPHDGSKEAHLQAAFLLKNYTAL